MASKAVVKSPEESDVEEKKPVGRPPLYKSEYVEQAQKLCLLGATDKELADFFEVCEATLNNWKHEAPEFMESIKSGKKIADAQVALKLYGRANGSEWIEQQAFKVKRVKYGENGKRLSEDEEVITVDVQRSVPPDTTACIFWLKNRKSDEWRDKVQQEVSGVDGEAIKSEITVKFVDSSNG